MKFFEWAAAHPDWMIYIATAVVTVIFKPRTAAEYDSMTPRLAGLVGMLSAFGCDVPKFQKSLRVFITGRRPPPDPPAPTPPAAPPAAGSEPPTKPDTPMALRTRGWRFAAIFAASLACASITGCGLLHAAVPVISEIVAIVSDAQEILAIIDAAAQLFFAQHPELVEARARYTSIMSKAHVSLDAAIRTMRGATELEQNKVDEAFANFRVAYGDLLALVESLGLTHGGKFAAGPRAGEAIPQPIAITYRVAK